MKLEDMTVKELREHAAKKKINLLGRDKKQDIIDTIVASQPKKKPKVKPSSSPGDEHLKAIEKDRAACVKALN